jgi:hypothetical protein
MRIDKAVAPLSNPRTPKDVDRLYVSPVAIVKLVAAPVFEIDPVVEELVSVVPLKVNADPVAKALVLDAYTTPLDVYGAVMLAAVVCVVASEKVMLGLEPEITVVILCSS